MEQLFRIFVDVVKIRQAQGTIADQSYERTLVYGNGDLLLGLHIAS